MIKSEAKEKLKKMIWNYNWINNEESFESKSNIGELDKIFELATEYQLTDEIDFLRLNINDFRILKKKYPNVLKKVLITLFMTNIKDISLEELEELKKDYRIQYLQVNSLYSFEKNSSMNLYMVYKYKKAIMRLIKGIDDNYLKEAPNREKKIFGIVLSKIIERTQYDKDIQDKSTEKNYFNKDLHNNFSNEMLGILKGKCVCRGYAGIIRDVFSELGIDVRVVTGVLNDNSGIGHAWNKIKLDGQWYNIDVTWDIKYISYRGESYWLLKNDEFFENGITIQNENGTSVENHRLFSLRRSASLPCNKSLSQEELSKYIDIERIRKKLWLNRLLTRLEAKKKQKNR